MFSLAVDLTSRRPLRCVLKNFAFEIQPTLGIRSRAKTRPDLKLAIFEVSKSDRRSEIRIIVNLLLYLLFCYYFIIIILLIIVCLFNSSTRKTQ